MVRPWPRKPPRLGLGSGLLLSALLGVGLALACIRWVDAALRPAVTTLAVAQAQNAVTAIINDAAAQVDLEAVLHMEQSEGTPMAVMTADAAALNALRTGLLDTILDKVEGLDREELGVPLGALTGFSAASDWGPILPVTVLTAAAPEAAFHSSFTAAGINQTLHKIVLDVEVEVTLLIPGGTVETSVTAQVPVSETLMVGEVPQTYLALP